MSKINQNLKDCVLIVDDEENVLHSLTRALKKQPYQILTAKTGEEAMWILKTRNVDVMVVDEQMPGMLGNDLLSWAAENVPDVVRIMLTGNATLPVAMRAINRGRVFHFFTKPCDKVQVAITICKAIEHRKLASENDRLTTLLRQQFTKLQRFSKKLGIMARLVANDLEMPLDKLAHSCSSLTNEYTEFLEPKAKTLLDDAVEAVDEIRQIVNDLLGQARSDVHEEFHKAIESVKADMEKITQDTKNQPEHCQADLNKL